MDSSNSPTSSIAAASAIHDEVEALRAENECLRFALEQTQEKLQRLLIAAEVETRTPADQGATVRARDTQVGEQAVRGGVAFAQMRRLLLKDQNFLPQTFLPYLNIEDLGRCSAVCRRFKKGTYLRSVIMRCVESGGVTDRTRGLLWLILVGMDPVDAKARGVLGVMSDQQTESPEEQYDRLHRAMNGTAAPDSPVQTTRAEPTSSAGVSPEIKSTTGVGTSSAGVAAIAAPVGEQQTQGEGTKQRENVENDVAGSGNSPGTGPETRDGGGQSNGVESAEGGGFSMGGESVFLWEETSAEGGGKGMRWRGSSRSLADDGSNATAASNGGGTAADEDSRAAESAGFATPAVGLKAEENEGAERIAAAVESADIEKVVCDAAHEAEAAAGIRPLGKSALEVQEMAEAGEAAAATAAAERGEKATQPAAGVVGWASGLFRRTASTTFASPPPRPAAGAASAFPHITENGEDSWHHRRDSSGGGGGGGGGGGSVTGHGHRRRESVGSMSTNVSSPLAGGRMSRGLLFGMRYPRHTRTKSELPASYSSSSNTGNRNVGGHSGFFWDSAGKESDGGCRGNGAPAADDDGWPAVERVPGLYSALLNSADAMDANDITGVRGPKQSCFVDIEKDLQRTLGMTDVTALRNVLRCTSTFVPDVGYVQGMNFVCRCLLQVFDDEEEAFWVFVGMLQKFGLRRLYCPGMPLLRLRFFQLNRLLMWHLPGLYGHFEACGVTADLYATSWFVTLLSDGGMLPDGEVKVMWDRIFLHASSPASQWASVFLVLLELLRRAEDTLKKETRFSELIQRLVNMPFRDLCGPRGACGMMEEAGRRFETSSPMPVQLLLLHDQWMGGGDEDAAHAAELGEERQLM